MSLDCSFAAVSRRTPRGRRATLTILATLAFTLFLSSCGTQFVYNRLGWFTHYYLSSQVSLDGTQSRLLRAQLQQFIAWHRRSELPRYADFLARAAAASAAPVSYEQMEAGRVEIEGFFRDAIVRAAPEASTWLRELRDPQLDELFTNIAERERKARAKTCELKPEERLENRQEKFIEAVEDWTGKLATPQRRLIETQLAASHVEDCAPDVDQERARLELRRLIERKRAHADFPEQLARHLTHPEELWDANYRAKFEANRERTVRMLVAINATLTPKQREHVVERLRGYEAELRNLSKNP